LKKTIKNSIKKSILTFITVSIFISSCNPAGIIIRNNTVYAADTSTISSTCSYSAYQFTTLLGKYSTLEEAVQKADQFNYSYVMDGSGKTIYRRIFRAYQDKTLLGEYYTLEEAKAKADQFTYSYVLDGNGKTVYRRMFKAYQFKTLLGEYYTLEEAKAKADQFNYSYVLDGNGKTVYRRMFKAYRDKTLLGEYYTLEEAKAKADQFTYSYVLDGNGMTIYRKIFRAYQYKTLLGEYYTLEEAKTKANQFNYSYVIDGNGKTVYRRIYRAYQDKTLLGEYYTIEEAKTKANQFDYSYVMDGNGKTVYRRIYRAYQDKTLLGEYYTIEEAKTKANQFDYSYVMDGNGKTVYRRIYRAYQDKTLLGEYYTIEEAKSKANQFDYSYVMDGNGKTVYRKVFRAYQDKTLLGEYYTLEKAKSKANQFAYSYVVDGNGRSVYRRIYRAYQDKTLLGEYYTIEDAKSKANKYENSYVVDYSGIEMWRNIKLINITPDSDSVITNPKSNNIQKNFNHYVEKGKLQYKDKYYINGTAYKVYVLPKGESIRIGIKWISGDAVIFTDSKNNVITDINVINKLNVVYHFNETISKDDITYQIEIIETDKNNLQQYANIKAYCDALGTAGSMALGNVAGALSKYAKDKAKELLGDLIKPANILAGMALYKYNESLSAYQDVYENVYIAGNQKKYEVVSRYVYDIDKAERLKYASRNALEHTKLGEIQDSHWYDVFVWSFSSFINSFIDQGLIGQLTLKDKETYESIKALIEEVDDAKNPKEIYDDIMKDLETLSFVKEFNNECASESFNQRTREAIRKKSIRLLNMMQ